MRVAHGEVARGLDGLSTIATSRAGGHSRVPASQHGADGP